MDQRRGWLVSACLVLSMSSPILASGFSIFEQSGKASGLAGAWVATADDAAACWYNPAAMTRLEGSQVQFGGNLITIGSDTDFTIDDAAWEQTAAAAGSPVANGQEFDAESSIGTPVHFYYTRAVSERWAWGVGLNTPFGLVTEWNDRPLTFSSRKAELQTFVLNPNLALKVSEGWSLAVGLDYVFADVKSFSREIPVDADLNPLNGFEFIGASNLTGDGDDWGFNAAAHFMGTGWSFGLTYRSAMSPEIDGRVEFSGFDGTPVESLFPDGPGTATIDLPSQAVIGVAREIDEGWTLEANVAFAGWSSFENLIIDFENETVAVQDVTMREDWDDTYSYRLGATWRLAPVHAMRFGIVFDESPVPVETMRPSIPDADRIGLTFGYGFAGSKWSLDAYYMPLWFDDITAMGDPAGKPGATSDPDGVIDGDYKSFVHLAGVTLSVRF